MTRCTDAVLHQDSELHQCNDHEQELSSSTLEPRLRAGGHPPGSTHVLPTGRRRPRNGDGRPSRPVRRAASAGRRPARGGQGRAQPPVRRHDEHELAGGDEVRGESGHDAVAVRGRAAPPRRRPGAGRPRAALEHRQHAGTTTSRDAVRSAHLAHRPAARAPPSAGPPRPPGPPPAVGREPMTLATSTTSTTDGAAKAPLQEHAPAPAARTEAPPFHARFLGVFRNRFGSDSVCAVHLKEPAGEPVSGRLHGTGAAEQTASGQVRRHSPECRSPAGCEVSQQRGKGALA